MSRFWRDFGKWRYGDRPMILPVIHVERSAQAMHQIEVAQGCGAQGAFLISHGQVSWPRLFTLYERAKVTYPDFWLGLNFLDLKARNAIEKLQWKAREGVPPAPERGWPRTLRSCG